MMAFIRSIDALLDSAYVERDEIRETNVYLHIPLYPSYIWVAVLELMSEVEFLRSITSVVCKPDPLPRPDLV